MIDLPNEAQVLALFVHRPGGAAAGRLGRGAASCCRRTRAVAETREGKQVVNLREGTRARVCRPVAGDHVAAIGENRKMLVFPLSSCPSWGAARACGCSATGTAGCRTRSTFDLADGLSWKDPAGRTRVVTDLGEWLRHAGDARAGWRRAASRGSNRFAE